MTTKELYQSKKDLFAQAELLKNKAGEEKKPMSKEDRETYKKYIEDIKGIDDQITLMDQENRLLRNGAEPFDLNDTKGENIAEHGVTLNDAVEAFIRKGPQGMTPEQRNVVKLGTDERHKKPFIEIDVNPKNYAPEGEKRATNSAIVNPTYVQETELYKQFQMSKKHYAGWMESTTELYTATGREMKLPYTDDAANDGAQESYGTDVVASTEDIALAQGTLNQYPFSSGGIKVDWDDLEDESIPMNEWLYKPLTERLLRKISSIATVGSGSTAPKGIAVAAAIGENVMNGTTPTPTDMNNLLKMVDFAYHFAPKSGWQFHSSTMFDIAATVKSATYNTEPLWQPSLAAGIPSTLYGYQYWVNNNLCPLGGAAAGDDQIMLFGDFSYQFNRFVGPMRIVRLVERYAELLQDAFFAYQRFDCDISLTATTYAPFKKMREVTT